MAKPKPAPASAALAPGAALNIRRLLAELGLAGTVVITREEADRVWGWPVASGLLDQVIQRGWTPDVGRAAEAMHGTKVSYREPGGVRPALQICFHPAGPDAPAPYFLELDIDEAAPLGGPLSFLVHAKEVVVNTVLRRKTSQARIAKLLDKRFKQKPR